MMGDGTWEMYFAGEAAQYGYPFPGNLRPGSSAERWTGEGSGAGKWRGGSALADQGPGVGWTLCGEGHTLGRGQGGGEEPKSGPGQRDVFRFSDSDISSRYVPYPVQSTTNRYVPMAMYLDTPFRYVPIHVRHVGHVPCIFFPLESRASTKSTHHTTPIHPNPIPSHPSMPCLGQCDLPRQHWMLAIKRAKHLMKRDEKHRSFSLLWSVCLSVRSRAERAHAHKRDVDICLSKHQRHPALV